MKKLLKNVYVVRCSESSIEGIELVYYDENGNLRFIDSTTVSQIKGRFERIEMFVELIIKDENWLITKEAAKAIWH